MSMEPEKDFVTLGDVFVEFREKWKKVFIITCVVWFLFTIIVMQKPNLYESEAVLVPNELGESNAAILSGGLGGIASLAGISINSFSDETKHYISMLQSADFLIPFMEANGIKKAIYSGRYLKEEERWKEPGRIKRVLHQWQMLFSPDEVKELAFTGEPSDLEAYKKFIKKHIVITVNQESKLITLTVRARSPTVAHTYALKLISSINLYARSQKLEEAKRMVSFLTNEIDENPSVEVKKASSQLLENQMKTIMLANTREDFAFKVIESPRVSYEKVSPARFYISLLGLLFGLMLSFLWVTIKILMK